MTKKFFRPAVWEIPNQMKFSSKIPKKVLINEKIRIQLVLHFNLKESNI